MLTSAVAAGPPQGDSHPLGGSDDTQCGAWGRQFAPASLSSSAPSATWSPGA
jgi:hypothetical protein